MNRSIYCFLLTSLQRARSLRNWSTYSSTDPVRRQWESSPSGLLHRGGPKRLWTPSMLTVITSRFDRQLLANKLSFAPCFMHILFNSNKFHKFWMSCACRHSLSKDGRNQRKSRPPGTFRANRPDTSTYMGPILLLEQCDMFKRFQNKVNISYHVGGLRRHKDQPKDPHTSAKIVKWGTTHPRGNVEC